MRKLTLLAESRIVDNLTRYFFPEKIELNRDIETARAVGNTIYGNVSGDFEKISSYIGSVHFKKSEKGPNGILSRPFRPFSKRFVRNGAKPGIHSRREAQQLQNPLLQGTQSRQMAIHAVDPLHHRQRHLLKRFESPLGCRASRFPFGITDIQTGSRRLFSRQLTPHHALHQRQDP